MKQTTSLKTCFTAQKHTLKTVAVAAMLLCSFSSSIYAQNNQDQPAQHQRDESYGNTLNLGLGVGYFSYLDATLPVFFANYEFNVARSFTLAPFIGFGSYQSQGYYSPNGGYYYYTETVIPIGVKGTYYFDQLLGLNPKWDLYAAASLGFNYQDITWQNGYAGDRGIASSNDPLFLAIHIGGEYHINRRLGLFLDLSSDVSTIGLAIHRR